MEVGNQLLCIVHHSPVEILCKILIITVDIHSVSKAQCQANNDYFNRGSFVPELLPPNHLLKENPPTVEYKM